MQSERSQVIAQKDTLEKVYQSLLEEHRALQTNYDEVASERDEATASLRETRKDADGRKQDKPDVMLRAEIDRLRADLWVRYSIKKWPHFGFRQKSEDNLGMAEAELDRNMALITDMTRKMEDLQERAEEAVKLKDRVDEWVLFAKSFLTWSTQKVPSCSGQGSKDGECNGEIQEKITRARWSSTTRQGELNEIYLLISA